MKIGEEKKGPYVWHFVPSRCFGQLLLSSSMRCYYWWLPELGSDRRLGIERRLYLTSASLRAGGHSSVPKPARRRAAASWCDRACQRPVAQWFRLPPLPCAQSVVRRSAISLPRIRSFRALKFSFFSQALNSLGKVGINTFYQITLDACLHGSFLRAIAAS